MGVLDKLFGKKSPSQSIHHKLDHFARSLVRHFNNLRDDFDMQKKWVDYLHNFSLRLQNDHHNHRSVTENELNNVKSWINHLHDYQTKQEKDIKTMEKNISELISVVGEAFNDVHSRIEKVEGRQKEKEQKLIEDVRRMVEKHKPVERPSLTYQEETPKEQESGAALQKHALTNPENVLLNLLLTESDPIGYTKIAEKTGKSINTVRVVMNSLKKKGFVEENLLPSGEKLFNAKNKERIKKIYNISHL